MTDPEVRELRERQQSGEEPETDDVDDGSAGSLGLSSIGISKRQLAVLMIVAAATLVAWKLYSDSSDVDVSDDSQQPIESLEGDGEEDDEEPESLEVPSGDQKEKDAAVLEHLRQTGRIGDGS